MKKSLFLVLALLCAPAAHAQNGPNSDSGSSFAHRYSARAPQKFYSPLESYGHIIRNPTDCAPNLAELVWGPGLAVLGYACVAPSANGD
jgi:hypothetical protein